ncbi:MAG: hypothetical protein H0X27_14640 [Caulobacteraceae bacterium]|nr:hypothetical protein [Caulobacteraceae bacterium]
MIDNPLQAERLLAKRSRTLPLAARATPEAVAIIRENAPGFEGNQPCRILDVRDSGDAGGIVCRLDLQGAGGDRELCVSITHLRWDPRAPLSHEVTAYQKHRVKRLRRLGA